MDHLKEIKDLQELKEKNGFDIGDREYRFLPMPWDDGNDLLAYTSEISQELGAGVAGFLRTQDFKRNIRPMLFKYTTVNGYKLDGEGMKNHFNEYQSDYFQFVQLAIQGLASPFLPVSNTNSPSKPKESKTVTLKRQM